MPNRYARISVTFLQVDPKAPAQNQTELCPVTVATVARWRSQGISPVYMKQPCRGGRVSYALSDLLEWNVKFRGQRPRSWAQAAVWGMERRPSCQRFEPVFEQDV